MYKPKFLRASVAAALFLAAAAAHASVPEKFQLNGSDTKSRHEMYVQGGLLGAGVGYAYGFNERLTFRGDVTTMGTFSKDFSTNDMKYKGKLRNNVGTLYADWFPFDSGFRLTAGVGFRDTRIEAHGKPSAFGSLKIGGERIGVSPDDSAKAEVKYPSVTPYLGIGYGHNVGQHAKAGWGFIADAGVYYGKPKVSFDVSESVMNKLNAATRGRGEEAIEKEKSELRDKIGKFNFIPALYVGVSYRF